MAGFQLKTTVQRIAKDVQKILDKGGLWSSDSQGVDVQAFLKELDANGLAMTCNYQVVVIPGKPGVTTTATVPQAEIAAGYQAFNLPDNGYKFGIAPESGFQITAAVNPPEPVELKYWDYGDMRITKMFWDMYHDQIDSDGLLKPHYACHQVLLYDNTRCVHLLNVAVGKPKFEQASAQAAVKLFSIQLVYEDYEDDLLGSSTVTDNYNIKS